LKETESRVFSGGELPEGQGELGDVLPGVPIARLDSSAKPSLEPPRLVGERPEADNESVRLLASVIERYALVEGARFPPDFQGRIDQLLEQLGGGG